MSNGNGNGKSRDWLIRILWSALLILGGGVLGGIFSPSLSQEEAGILLQQAADTHGRFQVTDTDHEQRLRQLENTMTTMAGDIREIRNVLRKELGG